MKARKSLIIATLAALASAAPAVAQQGEATGTLALGAKAGSDTAAVATNDSAKAEEAESSMLPGLVVQHFRPYDQRGLNVFEPPKEAGVPFEGFKLRLGAAFTHQFQGLEHSNTAAPKLSAPDAAGKQTNLNQLLDIGYGFNNAVANLYLDAQITKGIRVAMTTYLSSRHHNEAWVKDGYLLIDDSPLAVPALEKLMEYVTIKAGHFEINYGDAHFRRSDNGNSMYNPFVGNYILDAFTTEIGTEVYLRSNGLIAMVGATGGEIKGNIAQPDDRSPAFLGKLGFDKQLNDDLRVRLTGSAYTIAKSPGNTLYAGDRAGSRFYSVLENTQSTTAAQFTSGLLNPGFRYKVTAFMVNPFIKYQGIELFGVAEQAKGRSATEAAEWTWNQYAVDAVYRFAPREQLFVGGRFNTAKGELPGMPTKVGADRYEIGGGWFITPNVMLKGEYVTQKYNDFPTADIRNGGKFNGFMVEGAVAF
jgi:hypothetical protein